MSKQQGIVDNSSSEVVTIETLLKSDEKRIQAVLGDDKNRFMAACMHMAKTDLVGVDAMSIRNTVMLSVALKLDLDKNLGLAYAVPYIKKNIKYCQFIIGYKGLIQLALRSGMIAKLNAIGVPEGAMLDYNPLTEYARFDHEKLHVGEAKGFAVYLETVGGFTKFLYLPKHVIEAHARKYSEAYKNDIAKGYKYSPWTNNFDDMAKKTMIKKISKYMPMSIDMKIAERADQAAIKKIELDERGKLEYIEPEYIDNNFNEDEALSEKAIATLQAEVIEIASDENIDKTIEDLFG